MSLVDFRMDTAELERYLRPDGPGGQELARRAKLVHARAQRLAHVSPHGASGNPPGYMRTRLVLQPPGRDQRGPYIDMVTMARSRGGFAYGSLQEFRNSYMRRAVTDLYGTASRGE